MGSTARQLLEWRGLYILSFYHYFVSWYNHIEKAGDKHMKYQGSVVTGQGQPFAIVIVKSYVINNHAAAKNMQKSLIHYFSGMPIILMAYDSKSIPTYYGQDDIVNSLAKIDMQNIPWKGYSVK